MNKEQTLKMAHKVTTINRTLILQNDFLNTVPNPKKLNSDEIVTRFIYLEKALENMYEMNQDLIDQLEEVGGYLYDLSDEMEDKDNETH